MNPIITLTNRNLRLFLRDKATVFFSFLSTLILVALYFLFIGKLFTDGISDNMPLSGDAIHFMVYLQMMAGVLVLNSMSLSIGAFTTIAKDFEDKRVDHLLLTPAKSHEILLAYYITGLIASFVLNTFTWICSFLVIGIATGYWLALSAFAVVLCVLFVAALISSSIVLLITALIKSSAAIGVVNGIAGTFLGFLCGIYLPYSNLGEGIKSVGSFLPFTHLTIWLKQVVLGDAFRQLGIEGEGKEILLGDVFSANGVGFAGFDVSLTVMLVVSGVVGVLCLAGAYILLGKRMRGIKS